MWNDHVFSILAHFSTHQNAKRSIFNNKMWYPPKKGIILQAYLPITATSLQWPLSCPQGNLYEKVGLYSTT